MKKGISVLVIFFLFSIHTVVFGQTNDSAGQVGAGEAVEQENESVYREYEKFIKILKEIQDKYVEKITLETILTNAYRGMLSGLDPYSQYFDKEELEDLKIETEGEFEGLGIEVVLKQGLLIVITPLVDSPAFKAGILAGDRIIKIDGEYTENMTIREAVKRLRGELGTKITLTVVHEGDTTPVDITIERAKIHVQSIRGARIVDDEYKIGYLAVSNFQENTVADLDKAVQDLLEKGMKSLVLDLRFNPGGLLNAAVTMADRFLERGVIVSTRGRDKRQNLIYHARKKRTYPHFPMVVLLNQGSASASEIVAGAIKDHKRGLLIGTKTFGKGSVQSLIPVGDGKAALKLTTARYYTPSGDCIHEKGIEPDIDVPLNFEELKALHEQLSASNVGASVNNNDGGSVALKKKGENHRRKDSSYVDPQLERAIDILKGIEVYAAKAGSP